MLESIKSKFILIAIVSVLAVSALAANSWWANSKVEAAIKTSELRSMALKHVVTMEKANLGMVLAAMDTIIDRAEGQIQPERAEIIAESITALNESGQALLELAETPEDKDAMTAIIAKIEPLAKGISVDLANLVSSGAPQEAFTAVDDIIDEFGESMTEALLSYEEKLEAELKASNKEVENSVAASNLTNAAVFIASVVILSGLLFTFGRKITGQIATMSQIMRTLAAGDRDVEIPYLEQQAEMGQMAQAVEVFKQNAIERERLEADQSRKREADERRATHVAELIGEFDGTAKRSLGSVLASAEQMKASAMSMTTIADEAGQRSSGVASASEQATANVQTVATATEELSASVEEISRQVAQSAQMALAAVETANATNAKVEGLADASQKIGEVVNLINDIAAQTNLLALNATIEASRAGEAGKGFAVVASEVKSLATQTAKATEEIGAQIAAIQGETQEAVAAIQEIGKSITEISDTATAIASAVEEQGAATREIAENVQQASSGTQNVSSNIVEVSRGVQETGSSAQQVLLSAEQLGEQSDELQAAVSSFLDRVKAA